MTIREFRDIFGIPRQWFYDNEKKLKKKQEIVAGRAVNHYNLKQVMKLRKK